MSKILTKFCTMQLSVCLLSKVHIHQASGVNLNDAVADVDAAVAVDATFSLHGLYQQTHVSEMPHAQHHTRSQVLLEWCL